MREASRLKPKAPVEGTHGEKAGGRGGAGPRLVSLSGRGRRTDLSPPRVG